LGLLGVDGLDRRGEALDLPLLLPEFPLQLLALPVLADFAVGLLGGGQLRSHLLWVREREHLGLRLTLLVSRAIDLQVPLVICELLPRLPELLLELLDAGP